MLSFRTSALQGGEHVSDTTTTTVAALRKALEAEYADGWRGIYNEETRKRRLNINLMLRAISRADLTLAEGATGWRPMSKAGETLTKGYRVGRWDCGTRGDTYWHDIEITSESASQGWVICGYTYFLAPAPLPPKPEGSDGRR